MNKAVLFSVRPEWCYKIATGEKTVEVRKTAPQLQTPYKGYLYCTKRQKPVLINLQNLPETPYIITAGEHSKRYELPDMEWARLCNGKVWAEFICDADLPLIFACSDPAALTTHFIVPGTGMSDVEIMNYLGNGVEGHGLHISELKIYDQPRELEEFGLTRAPQSWCYVKETTE